MLGEIPRDCNTFSVAGVLSVDVLFACFDEASGHVGEAHGARTRGLCPANSQPRTKSPPPANTLRDLQVAPSQVRLSVKSSALVKNLFVRRLEQSSLQR